MKRSPSFGKSALVGAAWSLFLTFPAAAVSTLLFRFPVPFGGYVSGYEAVPLSVLAVFFYGVIFGGFVIVSALGATAGLVAHQLLKPDLRNLRRWTIGSAGLVAVACVLVLAVLDKFIGPW